MLDDSVDITRGDAGVELTCDYLWRGRLRFWQPAKRHGYRFNLDPVLLAGFAKAHERGHVIDFGAGCGIVGIMLLALGKAERVTAVEVQPELAALIRRNAQANGFGDRMQVCAGDLRTLRLPQADAVIFNPPYYPAAQFRRCLHPGRDQGRREQNGTLADFVRCAMAALKPTTPDAEMSAIVPAVRYAELCAQIRQVGGVVREARQVWPRASGPAAHVLVAAERQRPGKSQADAPLSAPLILHEDDSRAYTPQVNAWVDGPPLGLA